jgi:hypothetical protein
MAVSAYVLIQTEVGKAAQVVSEVAKIEGADRRHHPDFDLPGREPVSAGSPAPGAPPGTAEAASLGWWR